MEQNKPSDESEIPDLNWKKVYILVLGWLLAFSLFMYAFSIFTA